MKRRWPFGLGVGVGFFVARLLRGGPASINPAEQLGFANYPAWKWFNERFPAFVNSYGRLDALVKKVFVRRIAPANHLDILIFGLSRVCMEDFQQVLNLCGNGFGIGAMQLMRGMYERHVTAAYLTEHPEDMDDFIDYHIVHQRKAVNQLKDTYKGEREILDGIVSEERRDEIEQQFQAIKDRFTERCECGKERIMMSWSKHHTGVLAQKAGGQLHKLYHYQYFRPTLLAHSTFQSVEARVVVRDDGTISFESEGQQNYIREALVGAHNLLLNVLALQIEHFNLGLDEELDQMFEDYKQCWVPRGILPD